MDPASRSSGIFSPGLNFDEFQRRRRTERRERVIGAVSSRYIETCQIAAHET